MACATVLPVPGPFSGGDRGGGEGEGRRITGASFPTTTRRGLAGAPNGALTAPPKLQRGTAPGKQRALARRSSSASGQRSERHDADAAVAKSNRELQTAGSPFPADLLPPFPAAAVLAAALCAHTAGPSPPRLALPPPAPPSGRRSLLKLHMPAYSVQQPPRPALRPACPPPLRGHGAGQIRALGCSSWPKAEAPNTVRREYESL